MNAAVILWAAGVAAPPLGTKLGVAVDRAGRVLVQPDLEYSRTSGSFCDRGPRCAERQIRQVITRSGASGDIGGTLRSEIIRESVEAGETSGNSKSVARKPFHYFDKGSLATIGRAAAIAQFGKIHISGFLAWLAWLFVHILFLIGFRNRLLVMIQWAWSYFTYERGARLITGSTVLPGWGEVDSGGDAEREILLCETNKSKNRTVDDRRRMKCIRSHDFCSGWRRLLFWLRCFRRSTEDRGQ